jgi:Phosphopantetheine attachment site
MSADGAEPRSGDATGDIDRAVLDVMSELFPGEQVSLDSDFFELGGDSSAAVEAVEALDRRHHVVRPVEVYLFSRLRDLASELSRRRTRR